jgi:hypothetical protein
MPKSEDFNRKMIEGWTAARDERVRRRAENKEAWKKRDWAGDRELTAAIPVDDEPITGSPALAQLRAILADIDQPLFRRVEVGEIILGYELAPGAAAGADPEMIASAAYRFFQAVIANPQTPENLKLKALRQIVAVEARRAEVRSTAEGMHERRMLVLGAANGERKRTMLSRAGAWPPASPDWALDISDTFSMPPAWLTMSWPPMAISPSYRQQGDLEVFRAQLREIRATNRPDTFWDDFAA